MKKLMLMIALAAITISGVYAATPVKASMAADTVTKVKKKKGVIKAKKKMKMKKDTTMKKM